MQRHKLAWLAVGFCLAALLCGCGSSSNPPAPPLSITTSALPNGVINVPYSATLSATGGVAPYAWNVASGSLPPGLSLSRAGVLSGTPTTSGGSSFNVAVADSQQPPSVANASLAITINAALQVTTTSLPNGSPNVFYSATLAASGGLPPYSWTITQGNLPMGLTLNATSGAISGTPTVTGTSSFTVQASDSEVPVATATASLSIVVNPPPPRDMALYVSDSGMHQTDQTGLQIQSDGSLTLLPSSPETAITGYYFAPSPTLPLLFAPGGTANGIESLLVNPDYSVTSYSSSGLLPGGQLGGFQPPSVDPTGANLYLPGPIDSNGTPGVTIFPANGSLQASGSIAIGMIGNTTLSRIVFTPDGTLGFISICNSTPPPPMGQILSYSRSSNGTLTVAGGYALPSGNCLPTLTVSPDGKYLADSEVQVYSIGSDGTLTPLVSQPFVFVLNGVALTVYDLTWDSTSSYLIAAAAVNNGVELSGGVGVLQFSGNTLTQTALTGSASGRVLRTGSFVYSMGLCRTLCPSSNILGFDLLNGQLTPLPGSPYPYGNTLDMVIY